MLCLTCCFSAAESGRCCRVMSSERVLFNRFNQRIITTNERLHTHIWPEKHHEDKLHTLSHLPLRYISTVSKCGRRATRGPAEGCLGSFTQQNTQRWWWNTKPHDRIIRRRINSLVWKSNFLCLGWVNLRKNQKHKETHFQSWAHWKCHHHNKNWYKKTSNNNKHTQKV